MSRTGRADYDQLVRFTSIPAGEPTFLLRGQDEVGVLAVRAYVQLAATAGADPAFLELASRQADAMAKWPVRKLPDVNLSEDERKRLHYAYGRRKWNRGDLSAEAIAERRGWNTAVGALTFAAERGPIWLPMDRAPRDGSGFLAFGIHDKADPPGAARGVRPGHRWWAIMLFDIWREPSEFVFAKDGAKPWSEPLRCQLLTVPRDLETAGG